MIPLPILIELAELCFAPWGYSSWYPSAPATPQSVVRIEAELKIVLPQSFIALSQKCAPYGGWFSSIGEDFQSPNHILLANESFHKDDEGYKPLPTHLVMLNHGHDGDCDCWNTSRAPNADGEYPIVYFSATVGEIHNPNYDFPSFAAYLEYLCRAHSKGAAPKLHSSNDDDAAAAARKRERYKLQKSRYDKMQKLLAPYNE